MAVIGLSGPHAIGKTTAVYRWLARYPVGLLGVIADNQWEAQSATDRTRVRGWKGTVEDKRALVLQHRASAHVAVIDSVRTTNLNFFQATDPVILVTCCWKVMEKVLKARCLANQKTYNIACWNQWKLDYESHRRYINFANKHLKKEQYRIFEIKDQVRDWPAVDEYFGQVFRRLHNALRRTQG